MVNRYILILAAGISLSLIGCTDAALIDTPRMFDTVGVDRTVLQTVEVIGRTDAIVLVNGSASTCNIAPGSRCTMIEYSDGSVGFSADIILENGSDRPTLAVDVQRCAFRCAPVDIDSAAVSVSAPYGPAETGGTATLFHTITDAVDYVDSMRVSTTVRRQTLSEQKTLEDLDITRRYNGFDVSDDTVRVPFDVFGLRSTELSVDTSYAIRIRHLGNRSEVASTVLEPPTYSGDPLSATISADGQGATATLRFVVEATDNPALQGLLGLGGTVVIQLVITLD